MNTAPRIPREAASGEPSGDASSGEPSGEASLAADLASVISAFEG